jgi:hypothetical protein
LKNAFDILVQIEECSKEALEIIKNGKFEELPIVLDQRSEFITSLDKAESTDLGAEKTVLHRIEKLESKMLEILKNSTSETKDSINTISVGKKAVKNGYFKSKLEYERHNRFLKRG